MPCLAIGKVPRDREILRGRDKRGPGMACPWPWSMGTPHTHTHTGRRRRGVQCMQVQTAKKDAVSAWKTVHADRPACHPVAVVSALLVLLGPWGCVCAYGGVRATACVVSGPVAASPCFHRCRRARCRSGRRGCIAVAGSGAGGGSRPSPPPPPSQLADGDSSAEPDAPVPT